MAKDPMAQRVVRVPDDLWERAKAKADERGETVSEVVRERLERYAPAPKPRRQGKHDGLSKALFTILQDADNADDVRVVALGNLDGQPFVWSYPLAPMDDGDLEVWVELAGRL